MNKLHVIFTRGIQGSGKSTWAKKFVKENQNYKRVCRDDIRHMIASYTFDDENEKLVTTIEKACIESIMQTRDNLVIDKMNLNKRTLEADKDYIYQLYSDYFFSDIFAGINFEIKDFPCTLEEAIERDSKRDFKIGERVIKTTWYKYRHILTDMLETKPQNIIPYDPNLPNCIVSDVDGTLAIRGDRSPYDYSKVHEDKVNEPVRDLVNTVLHKDTCKDTTLFIFSGRDDICDAMTFDWLRNNNITYDYLVMRRTGDKRKDSIVKKEMFDKHIRGKYNCLYWVDDRRQVIDMVRNELGICCLDVAGNNF